VALLELDDVVKHYIDADEVVRAVDGVTLQVGSGEVHALYGPSGSGKTTLLLLAAGLVTPQRGRVQFEGENLASMAARALAAYQRTQLGFIYQAAHLMTGVPAVENAAVKLLADGKSLRHARSRAAEWLERLGLADRLERTPERLSGGERQRVAIARALVTNPRLVLADEPTGNLDTRRGSQILKLLAALSREQGTTVLVATHDPRAIVVADAVHRLRDGKVEQEIAPQRLSSPPPPQLAPSNG
jgi:putative ABC transport system ATP-binding protein